jgi:hypothetical protein
LQAYQASLRMAPDERAKADVQQRIDHLSTGGEPVPTVGPAPGPGASSENAVP